MRAQRPVDGTFVRNGTVTVDGRRRTALEVTPSDARAPADRLVLAVHGSNQSPTRFRSATARTLDALAADGSSIVTYPGSWRGGLWNDARISTPSRAREDGVDDLAFLRALIERHRARGARRVVAVGYSNGGQLLIRALRDTPDLLDGVVLVGPPSPPRPNNPRPRLGYRRPSPRPTLNILLSRHLQRIA